MRPFPVLLTLTLAGALPGVTPRDAEAAPAVDASDLERAKQVFADGQKAMAEEHWDEAAQAFREAAAIKNTPGIRYHVAFCEEQSGRLVEARRNYLEAQRLLDTQPAKDVEGLLGEALARLDQRIPTLEVALDVAPETDVTISLNGERQVDWDGRAPRRFDAGSYVLQVTATGYHPKILTFDLAERDRRRVDLSLTPETHHAPVEAPPTEPRDDRSSGTWRTVTLASGVSLATVGLGVGVWGLLQRANAAEDVGRTGAVVDQMAGSATGVCHQPEGSLQGACSDLKAALDDRDQATGTAIAGFAAFGVGLGAALTTLWLWPDAPVSVQTTGSDESAGLRVSGTF